MFINSLRQNKPGAQPAWTRDELLAGLKHFKELYGRFPTAHEIDSFAYLPSSRSIQRSYGGLVSLRKELLPNEIANFTTGAYRSGRAQATYANSKDLERGYFEYLTTKFAEIAVHEHKVIRPGSVSCDFYIYLSEKIGAAVDIFYAGSMRNLVNVVNIKLKRYSLISNETYLVVVGNDAIEAEKLLAIMASKRLALPKHISVVTDRTFRQTIVPALQARSAYSKRIDLI